MVAGWYQGGIRVVSGWYRVIRVVAGWYQGGVRAVYRVISGQC